MATSTYPFRLHNREELFFQVYFCVILVFVLNTKYKENMIKQGFVDWKTGCTHPQSTDKIATIFKFN